MTLSEFSDTFDTILNSFNTQAKFGEGASKQDIVLDEYEKSVLLTQAQDLVVKSYFDGTLNQQGQGFDDSTRRQVDFSSLIKTATCTKAESQTSIFDDRGIIFTLPRKKDSLGADIAQTTDVLFLLNERFEVISTQMQSAESAGASSTKSFVVVPINYKEYDREMSKPYAQPLKKQAWRLFQNTTTGFDIYSEVIPRWDIEEVTPSSYPGVKKEFAYKIRYVKRPNPIVLTDLPDDLNIDGVNTQSECTLNPIIHMDILNKAVELAIATRGGGVPKPE